MNITIYTTKNCPFCKMTKEYLTANNFEYTEQDVGNKDAAKQMIEKTGQRGVPVTDIDGKIIVGFDQEALDEALGLKS